MRATTIFLAMFIALAGAVPQNMLEERAMSKECVRCRPPPTHSSASRTDLIDMPVVSSCATRNNATGALPAVGMEAVRRVLRHLSYHFILVCPWIERSLDTKDGVGQQGTCREARYGTAVTMYGNCKSFSRLIPGTIYSWCTVLDYLDCLSAIVMSVSKPTRTKS